jgi:hypothetical protein
VGGRRARLGQMIRHAFPPDLEEHLLVGEAVQPLFLDQLPIIGRRWWLFRRRRREAG